MRLMASGGWQSTFDPERQAILLAAGNKTGVPQTRFYQRLIRRADARFDDYLARRKGSSS